MIVLLMIILNLLKVIDEINKLIISLNFQVIYVFF